MRFLKFGGNLRFPKQVDSQRNFGSLRKEDVMTAVIPRYGDIARMPLHVLYDIDTEGIFAGINDRDEYVLLARDFGNNVHAIVGKSCKIKQFYDTDNMPAKQKFIMEDYHEAYLLRRERIFAGQFMERSGL